MPKCSPRQFEGKNVDHRDSCGVCTQGVGRAHHQEEKQELLPSREIISPHNHKIQGERSRKERQSAQFQSRIIPDMLPASDPRVA